MQSALYMTTYFKNIKYTKKQDLLSVHLQIKHSLGEDIFLFVLHKFSDEIV